jgi:hypothetical protein
MKIMGEVSEYRVPSILVRQYRVVGLYWPSNAEGRIIPKHASIMLGGIIAIDLIDNLGGGFESAIAMGEPLRYEDLVPLGGAEHDCHMPPKGRRAPAYIGSDIKHRTCRYAQQFCLRKWRDLEMKPANDPFACRQGMIVLDKMNVNSMLQKYAFLENFREEATLIIVTHRPYYLYFGNVGFRNLHSRLGPPQPWNSNSVYTWSSKKESAPNCTVRRLRRYRERKPPSSATKDWRRRSALCEPKAGLARERIRDETAASPYATWD